MCPEDRLKVGSFIEPPNIDDVEFVQFIPDVEFESFGIVRSEVFSGATIRDNIREGRNLDDGACNDVTFADALKRMSFFSYREAFEVVSNFVAFSSYPMRVYGAYYSYDNGSVAGAKRLLTKLMSSLMTVYNITPFMVGLSSSREDLSFRFPWQYDSVKDDDLLRDSVKRGIRDYTKCKLYGDASELIRREKELLLSTNLYVVTKPEKEVARFRHVKLNEDDYVAHDTGCLVNIVLPPVVGGALYYYDDLDFESDESGDAEPDSSSFDEDVCDSDDSDDKGDVEPGYSMIINPLTSEIVETRPVNKVVDIQGECGNSSSAILFGVDCPMMALDEDALTIGYAGLMTCVSASKGSGDPFISKGSDLAKHLAKVALLGRDQLKGAISACLSLVCELDSVYVSKFMDIALDPDNIYDVFMSRLPLRLAVRLQNRDVMFRFVCSLFLANVIKYKADRTVWLDMAMTYLVV
jgi:hypothetical protein